MKSIAVLLATFAFTTNVFAVSSPKFNKDNKMKPNDVFKKCGEWAAKETNSMKSTNASELEKKHDRFISLAESCSFNNGFDPKGDSGNLLRIKKK